MKSLSILGVKIDNISKKELLEKITNALASHEKLRIYTVNNEFVVEAQTNQDFRDALNNASFSIADSSGVVWAAKKLYQADLERIPGADLFIDLVKLSSEGHGIYLLGGDKGVAEKAKAKLEQEIENCNITGTLDGIKILPEERPDIVSKINASKASIICVALGAPKQELWIEKNYKQINASIFIGIGGTLDFASGTIKRAPKIFRELSLEWLYRLIRQPSRYPRIKKAVLDFPKLVNRRAKNLD